MTKDPSGPAHGVVASSTTPIGGARKRLFDIVLSLAGLIILAPLLLGLCGLLRLARKGPVLARETMIGAEGRRFARLTFNLSAQPAGEAATAGGGASLGRVLSRSGLATLPQLVNVLAGDMSFVGPPALRPSEWAETGEGGLTVPRARPGMIEHRAGPRQAHHEDYARNWSFAGDLRLLWQAMTERRGGVFY
ncbi:MAG: sugar transferase [Beijerinckiaceae bacterium]|nr:sugar transferase [Beijerinckiaceae bacterium]